MGNYSAYFAIEKQMKSAGFTESRSEVVGKFTAGRKHGLSELSAFEYAELLRWMNRTFLSGSTPPVSDDQAAAKDKMRKKIIAILCKMGYKTPDGRADMPRINAWSVKYGVAHKNLNGNSYMELTQLVTQAELACNKFIKGL